MPDELNHNENITSCVTESLPTDNQNSEVSQVIPENMVTDDHNANTLSSEREHEFKYISLANIEPDIKQPRQDFSELDGLINSIEQDGLIYPITVAPHPEMTEKYIIVDGERRFRAYQKLYNRAINDGENNSKYAHVLSIVMPSFEQQIGIVVNLLNKGYNCLEIAYGMKCLLDEGKKADGNFTQKELAEKLGKSQANISEYISLLDLPLEIQEQERKNPCVPFNKLKQLSSSKISPQEKVKEYNNQRFEYEKKSEEENEDKNESSSKNKSAHRGSSPHNTILTLTKKLDVTSKALGKFKIENMSEKEKNELNTKLKKLIDDAQKIKGELENGTNTN